MARAISTPGSLESGGEISTVTTKRPDWQACSKPNVSRAGAARRADDGRRRMRAVDHPQPGRAVPKPVIDRLEERSCRAARRSASCRRSLRSRRSASSDRPRRRRRRERRRTARCASAWRNWSGRPCRSRRARTGRTSCNRRGIAWSRVRADAAAVPCDVCRAIAGDGADAARSRAPAS